MTQKFVSQIKLMNRRGSNYDISTTKCLHVWDQITKYNEMSACPESADPMMATTHASVWFPVWKHAKTNKMVTVEPQQYPFELGLMNSEFNNSFTC